MLSAAQLAAILVLVLLAALLAVLLRPTPRAPLVSYASPAGTGSACTEAAPCTLAAWLGSALVVPGAVLILEDGTYTGSQQHLTVPSTFAGTAEAPITIRARHEGRAILRQDGGRPVHLQGRYGVLEGVNIVGGDNNTLRFHTSAEGWQVRRVVVEGTGAPDLIVNMEGRNNLLEDCAVYGVGRYVIGVATSGEGNVVRRCWARWQDNQFTASNPTDTVVTGYGQNGITLENVLITMHASGRVTDPGGPGALWGTQESAWLGVIVYAAASDIVAGGQLVGGTVDAGSHAQQGRFNPTSQLRFKHVVAYIDPGNPRYAAVKALAFSEGTDPGCPPGVDNQVRDSVGVGGLAPSFSSSWQATNLQLGTSLAAAIGAGKSLWTDSVAAPGVCRRYVGRTLTAQPLWPWPMNQRILETVGVNVTGTVEALFGPIPAQCRTDAGPTPPAVQAPTGVKATLSTR